MRRRSVIPGWDFSFLVVDTIRVVFCRNDITYYAQGQQSKANQTILPTASPNRAKQINGPAIYKPFKSAQVHPFRKAAGHSEVLPLHIDCQHGTVVL